VAHYPMIPGKRPSPQKQTIPVSSADKKEGPENPMITLTGPPDELREDGKPLRDIIFNGKHWNREHAPPEPDHPKITLTFPKRPEDEEPKHVELFDGKHFNQNYKEHDGPIEWRRSEKKERREKRKQAERLARSG
jgi:hypothetical protein